MTSLRVSGALGALLLLSLLAGALPAVSGADSDGDGVDDLVDACPYAAGNSTLDRTGCPDTDGDGTSDLADTWASPVGGYAESGLNDTGRDIMAVGIKSDGSELAFGQDNGIVRIYNVTTRLQRLERVVASDNSQDIGQVEWNPNGTLLAVGVNWADDEVHIINPGNFATMRTLDGSNGQNDNIVGIAWSPNGTYLALTIGARQGSNVNGEIRVYNALNGSLVQTFDPLPSDDNYGGIVFSPDGKRLLMAGPGRAWIYNTADWSWNGTIAIHTSGDQPRIDAVDWSPDGNSIALCERTDGGSQGARVGIWNATNFAQEWQRPNQFSTSCLTTKFSPDGSVLAVGLNNNGADAGDIYLFNSVSGTLIDISRGQDSRVKELVWTPDAMSLVSAHESQDGGGGGGERDGLVWWDFDLDGDNDGWNTTDMGDGLVDRFPSDGTQWNDTDNDGFGDNWANESWNGTRAGGPGEWVANASAPDACPTTFGTSSSDRGGCPDTDLDGWSDPDGGWTVADGADAFVFDWWQHADADLDGVGDSWYQNGSSGGDGLYLDDTGDPFPNNPTQWYDTDRDGYGDNYNQTAWQQRWLDNGWPGQYLANATLGDAFPQLAAQWNDTDGDGWGDNTFDTRGDWCIHVPGGLLSDRSGCPDTDGDGYSDPDANESASPAGTADAFPLDPTQWADTDGDTYGDNGSGNNGDDCSGLWGNSTVDRFGCPDEDGDGWSDIRDAFDSQPTQWNDTDADGYGDNWDIASWNATRNSSWPGEWQEGAYQPDRFPLDGTQQADSDGDGYGDNSNGNFGDIWPADPTQWFDFDGDGFGDNASGTNGDQCPQQRGTSMDPATRGCPDSDGDGVVDLEDPFPNNPLQSVDADGDGYGDSPTTLDADDCVGEYGTSSNGSRFGCPDADNDTWADIDDPFPNDPLQWVDTDGDGYGDNYGWVNVTVDDPDVNGSTLVLREEWGDAFHEDASQWSDRDGDGHGDNASGTSADKFPFRFSQWRDSDNDGYGDSFLFGSWEPDGCRLDSGTSTINEFGCPDRDGDGYSDRGDACPDDPEHHTVPAGGCAEVITDDPTEGAGDVEGGSEILGQSPLVWLGIVIVFLLLIIVVGMVARTSADRKAKHEREIEAASAMAFEDIETGQRRMQWIEHYVGTGDLDKARELGWDGMNPPPPRASTEPSWQQLADGAGLQNPVDQLPAMPSMEEQQG